MQPGGRRKTVAVGMPVNPAPPAQIRACATNAHGSYLGWLRKAAPMGKRPSARRRVPMSRFPGTVPGPCSPLQRSPRSTAFPPVPPRTLRRLFGTFTGTTRQSDFPSPCMRGAPLWVPSPVRRFLRAAGSNGISWFPCIEFPCMRGVCDPGEPSGFSRLRLRPCCLPLRLTASALPIAVFGTQYLACRCPCQRFTPHLSMRRA